MHLGLGKVAVVVGGASGIGLASARLFAEEGCRVAIWDLNPPKQSFDGLTLTVDIRNSSSIEAALQETITNLGSIDHLVHAAAVGSGSYGQPFTCVKPQQWHSVFDVNVHGMMNVAHAIAPKMMQAKLGTIVSVASVAGQIGSPSDPPYSASKAAGINFAQCMARDLASGGVRVNTVCPGMVKTPLNRSVWASWQQRDPDSNTLNYEAWADQKIKDLIPLGRWQTAEDVADMIVFLSSNRSRQVTGQTINVDGGYVMHW
ncbi:SDR family oxidoreductase [bacterium]|nr:SDR family oxidoreductase [bacterium]